MFCADAGPAWITASERLSARHEPWFLLRWSTQDAGCARCGIDASRIARPGRDGQRQSLRPTGARKNSTGRCPFTLSRIGPAPRPSCWRCLATTRPSTEPWPCRTPDTCDSMRRAPFSESGRASRAAPRTPSSSAGTHGTSARRRSAAVRRRSSASSRSRPRSTCSRPPPLDRAVRLLLLAAASLALLWFELLRYHELDRSRCSRKRRARTWSASSARRRSRASRDRRRAPGLRLRVQPLGIPEERRGAGDGHRRGGILVPLVGGLLKSLYGAGNEPRSTWSASSRSRSTRSSGSTSSTPTPSCGAMDDLAGISVVDAVARAFVDAGRDGQGRAAGDRGRAAGGVRGENPGCAARSASPSGIAASCTRSDLRRERRRRLRRAPPHGDRPQLTTGVRHDPRLVRLARACAEARGRTIHQHMILLGASDDGVRAEPASRRSPLPLPGTRRASCRTTTRLDALDHDGRESLSVMLQLVLDMIAEIDRGACGGRRPRTEMPRRLPSSSGAQRWPIGPVRTSARWRSDQSRSCCDPHAVAPRRRASSDTTAKSSSVSPSRRPIPRRRCGCAVEHDVAGLRRRRRRVRGTIRDPARRTITRARDHGEAETRLTRDVRRRDVARLVHGHRIGEAGVLAGRERSTRPRRCRRRA